MGLFNKLFNSVNSTRIALWGYSEYGRRTAESMYLYWGREHTVTRIYDENDHASYDPYWNIAVSDPSSLEKDYRSGAFQSVMVCIYDKPVRDKAINELRAMNIPVWFPGNRRDLDKPGDFSIKPAVLQITQPGYKYRVYTDMLGALADYTCAEDGRPETMYLFNKDGKLLFDHWTAYEYMDKNLKYMYPFRLRDPLPEKVEMKGAWCVLAKPYCGNYWHFTDQSMDCVLLLEEAGYTGKYIVSNELYNHEVMKILGIPEDRIVPVGTLDLHKVYAFEELHQVTLINYNRKFSAPVVHRLGQTIGKQLEIDPAYPKYIYVKRIGSRRLLNDDDIFEKHGFVTIIPEHHSVKEQMTIFHNAKIVVSPHGANCVDCIYMQEGTVFVEFFSDHWFFDVYADVCKECGVHHFPVIGHVPDDVQAAPFDMYAHYSVPEDRIIESIEKAYSLIGEKMPS